MTRWGLLAGLALAAALVRAGTGRSAAPSPADADYVDDALCGDCHGALSASYERDVGMARSFGRPRDGSYIEDFSHARVDHAPSGQHFELVRRGAGLLFRRFTIGTDGRPRDLLEQPVDYWLGSGHHARVYLYRTPWGELYQLPIAWYAQEGRLGMAPGYDRAEHDGVLRRVRRECFFCHNAYPDGASTADARHAPQRFPEHLPEGVGCQRCHGPGGAHVAAVAKESARVAGELGAPALARIRATIVNPARLPPARRDDVCLGCHLQPALALPGVRRFGRGDFSFRPGEALADYLVQVDADYAGQTREARFEINHHPYRLRQSRCFQASAGRLSCLTCHDPHAKPAPAERAARFRAACLGCHQRATCGSGKGDSHDARADCVGCHMPRRRPQDVVHVVMTDHLIQRHARPEQERLAPLAERDPVVRGVTLTEPHGLAAGLPEIYGALALASGTRSLESIERLAALLQATPVEHDEPWLALAEGQLVRKRYGDAQASLRRVLARSPAHVQASEWNALALAGLGRHDEAIAAWRALDARGAAGPEALFNLGRVLLGRGHAGEALVEFERALALRPNLPAAWFQRGEALLALGRTNEARAAWERALVWDPLQRRARARLQLGPRP